MDTTRPAVTALGQVQTSLLNQNKEASEQYLKDCVKRLNQPKSRFSLDDILFEDDDDMIEDMV